LTLAIKTLEACMAIGITIERSNKENRAATSPFTVCGDVVWVALGTRATGSNLPLWHFKFVVDAAPHSPSPNSHF
jgi:hypothetical protein